MAVLFDLQMVIDSVQLTSTEVAQIFKLYMRRQSSACNPQALNKPSYEPWLSRLMQRWKQVHSRLPGFRRSSPRIMDIPPDLYIDANGLPGNVPEDVSKVLKTISGVMEELQVPWFIAGDLLLAYYRVPQITGDLEIVVPSENLPRVQAAFDMLADFYFPFRYARSEYARHLRPYPRFKVKGMHQCFCLVPGHHYGVHPKGFQDILSNLDERFLPLPHYIQGLVTMILNKHIVFPNNFLCQLEFLIDGSDLDEDWCNLYLDGRPRAFVRSRSSRVAKKSRMGSTPKHEGNLTMHIRNEEERQEALRVPGRTIDLLDHTLSLQVMSDMHLELTFLRAEDSRPGYEVFHCAPCSPMLALLGDIGITTQDGLFGFLRRQLFQYEKVFFLMGNHEFYQSTFESAKSVIKKFSEDVRKERVTNVALGKFIFLDQTRYDLTDGVTILGCTLWSHIPSTAAELASLQVNDFKRIKEWSVERHNAAHLADAEWLGKTCTEIRETEPHRRIVIMTHHAPLMQGTSSLQHQGGLMNCAFATDMSTRACWGNPVTHWIFGHTHFSCDFIHNGVRLVSNQREYEGIETGRVELDEDLILSLSQH
ncbi:hypothetical protein M422DRAFT_34990 [Sphaerobolus stellatus SS14]|uniref:Calcineurin-like phosphoesterase domain-containing protein n=1 Tax=Sphaerobolus stellatus (strain SS14) TaxID=990650 RepID=A0A0C9UZA8_SPHS4|nr:hypothetical protein M422DRAFT_34990 [Sphaerobolus stellatus SS14]